MGRPKKEQTEKIVSTSVRLPESKHEALKEYSKNNYRSISEQIEMIIDSFFERVKSSKGDIV